MYYINTMGSWGADLILQDVSVHITIQDVVYSEKG